MLKISLLILAGLIALIVLLALYASMRPNALHVERGIVIAAAPDKIFPHINDFRAWDAWTPYNKDPAMKKTYGATSAGKGATYAWEGNSDVGKGEIHITDTAMPNRIALDLHMIKPFEARNDVVFSLTPEGNGTKVVWAMDGKNNLVGKMMGVFMDMDKMVGGDFEKGLANLKRVAER